MKSENDIDTNALSEDSTTPGLDMMKAATNASTVLRNTTTFVDTVECTEAMVVDTPTNDVVGSIFDVPGPTKLVLVDSNLFKGAVSEIPLDGNTLITGTNAAGKTSLIQLMPLFYGAETQTISNKRHGKSFYGHYLPNATSYVAFEYRARNKQPRSVVIYEDIGGESLVYRFVRSALYEDMFVQDNGEFVPNEDFVSHLRQRGYKFASRQISTVRDYRTIIQGGKPTAKKKEDQRHMNDMVMEYTVAPRGVVLQDAHKVVQAILKRKMSLPDLEKMIVNKILGEQSKVDVNADRESLLAWPKKYLAYQNVMKKAGEASNASLLLERKKADVKERNKQIQFLVAFGLLNNEKRAVLQKEESQKENDRENEKNAFNERSNILSRSKSELEVKLTDVESRINELKKDEARLLSKNAPELAKEEEGKEAFTKELESLRSEIASIEGDQKDISSHYEVLINQVNDDFTSQREAAIVRKEDIGKEFAEKVKAMKADIQIKRDAFVASFDEKLKQLSDELSVLEREIGKKEEALKNPSVDRKVEEGVEAAESVSEQADNERDISGEKLSDLISQHEEAKKAKHKAQKVVDSLNDDKRTLEKEIRELEERKQPVPGSLLAFLRKDVPGWEETIGKVINPALLKDKSLYPVQVTNGATKGFYGIQINLDGLEPCPETSVEELKTRILEKEALVSDLDKKMKPEKQALKSAITDEEELAGQVLQEKAKHERLKENATKMRERKNSAREAKRKALADVMRLAQEKYDTSLKDYNAKRNEKKAAENEKQKHLDGFVQQEWLSVSSIERDRDEKLKAIDSELEIGKRKKERRVAEYEDQRSKALSAAGVDTERLDDIRARTKALQKRLTDIAANYRLVGEWIRVSNDMKSKLPEWEMEQKRLAAEIVEEEKRFEKERDAWRAIDDRLLSEMKIIRAELKSIEGHLARGSKALDDFEAASDENEQVLLQLKHPVLGDAAQWKSDVFSLSFDEVHADYLNVSSQLNERRKEIRASVRSLQKVFRDSEAGSPPRQYIEQYVVQEDDLSSEEWVEVFKTWFNEAHNEQLNTLVRDARSMLVRFDAMFSQINDVHRLVKNENNRLQKNLNKIPFQVIQDLQVRIVSKVEDLGFMEPLEKLSNLYRKWDKSKDVHPPQEFGAMLESLEGHWMGKQGISADLRDCIKIEGQITENNNRREFNAYTDMMDISSNGMSYLVLTTILVGFINMVRQGGDVHFIWAVDELGDIDEKNTVALLEMLRQNKITMVSATPSTSAAISKMFDYRQRFKKINGEVVLVSVEHAGSSPVRMEKSPPSLNKEITTVVRNLPEGDV